MRRRPDPDQTLFKWVWHDEMDDWPDGPDDDEPPAVPPPLRSRVRGRHPAKVLTLCGWTVRVGKPPDAILSGV